MPKYLVITRPTVTEVVEEEMTRQQGTVLGVDGIRRTWADIDRRSCRLRRREGEQDSSLERGYDTSPGRSTSSEIEPAESSSNVLVNDFLLPTEDVPNDNMMPTIIDTIVFPDMSLLSESALARDLEGSSVVDPDVDVTGGETGAALPPGEF